MRKALFLLGFAMLCITSRAQSLDAVAVDVNGTVSEVAISDIREITFGDTAMNIVKNDNTTLVFENADNWSLSFCEAQGGTTGITISGADMPATVYDTNGVVVGSYERLSDLDVKNMPRGVYIISSGDRSFKIIR